MQVKTPQRVYTIHFTNFVRSQLSHLNLKEGQIRQNRRGRQSRSKDFKATKVDIAGNVTEIIEKVTEAIRLPEKS